MKPELSHRNRIRVPVGGRLLLSTSTYSAFGAILLVLLVAVLAWGVCWWAGGSRSVAPHIFYVAVALAAVRFGRWGALATGLAAGLLAGPFLPLDVDTGTSQETLSWVLRAGAFTSIGLLVAFFVHHSTTSVGDELARVMIRRDLRRALDDRHLHVAYQPIVALDTGRTIGAEALIRWTDPDRGAFPPDQWIPLVEDAGIAHLVSDFVLHDVVEQLSDWQSSGLINRDDGFKMAVNISGTELWDNRLERLIRDLIVRASVPADWLHLEVTETALIDNLDAAINGLQRLRGVGVRLAIDDFGTGESSLNYLHRFPVTTLKIDRSFIVGLVDDERGRCIVKGVVNLARDLGLTTVAEGVETSGHAEVLASMGCDLAQGYHFARPLSPPDFSKRLAMQAPALDRESLRRQTHRTD